MFKDWDGFINFRTGGFQFIWGVSMSLHSINFYRKVVLLSWNFLSLKNLTPHYKPWTSKEIFALRKLYYCFEVFFLLEILPRNLDMVVLEEFSLVLNFSKFLADLKMSSGLLKCCLILHISSSWYFAVFAPFNYLRSPWCNFFCKFSVIGLSPGLKSSCKILSLYLSQEILIFSWKGQFLEKRWNMYF